MCARSSFAALALILIVCPAVAGPPASGSMLLRLEVDGVGPPALGRYVIQRRACRGGVATSRPRSVAVAWPAEQAPARAIRVPPGCYDVRFESIDRRGVPTQACELGAAAGVAVRGDMPTTVIFVGHCEASEPPLVN